MAQKRAGIADFTKIPNGGTGVEERLALLYTYGVCEGRITLEHMVDLLCTRPARIFGLYPRKGSVAIGGDADLVVWDPTATRTISARTHHSKSDRNIFEGFSVKGRPRYVIVNGTVRVRDGELRVERGAGRFVRRETSIAAARADAGAGLAGARAQAR